MKIYKKLIKPLLFLMNPEKAHNFTINSQKWLGRFGLKPFIKPFFSYKNPMLQNKVWGIDFQNPIGLPAGCDKKGDAIHMWETFGFGWATAGSITSLPQPGNDKPRLFRLLEDDSMQVNFGLNSIGAKKMHDVLKKKKTKIPYGISIARTTAIPDEEVVGDYISSFNRLYHLPKYFEINISCPNIPDTEYFKRGNFLSELLEKLQEMNIQNKPLLLKIGPDLNEDEIAWIAKNVLEFNIHGVIISNLIKDTSKLKVKSPLHKGGISGRLLQPFADKTLELMYKKTEGKVPLVGLGGIVDGKDAYRKIKLGASMLQLYSGMVLEGPGVVKRVLKELTYLLKKDGYQHYTEAIGKK